MQPTTDPSDELDEAAAYRAAESAFFAKERKRLYWLVRKLLIIAPIICAVAQIIANVVAERRTQYSVSAVSRSAIEAVITVASLHVLVWWAWKNRQGDYKPGVVLFALLTMGLVTNSLVSRLDPTRIGDWARLPLGASILAVVSFSWAKLTVTLMTLQLFGSALRYRFVDRANAVSDVTVNRVTWSIRGMFAGTLVAALLLALLQWVRGLYLDVMPDGYYPTSDLAPVIWLGCAVTCDVLCLYAAAARRLKKRIVGSILLVVLACLISLLGMTAYWAFVPGYQGITVDMVAVPAIVDVVVMTGLHWVVLGYWQRAGYQLQRSV